jgi:hypothetical protein
VELKAGIMNLSWDTSYPDPDISVSTNQPTHPLYDISLKAREVGRNSRTVGEKGVGGKGRMNITMLEGSQALSTSPDKDNMKRKTLG